MVQILQRAPSSSDRFARAFAGLGSSLAKDIPEHLIGQREKKREEERYGQENAAVKQLIGKDISGIRDPKIRQKFVDMALEAANQEQKGSADFTREMAKLSQQHQYGLEDMGVEHGYGLEKLGKQQEYGLEKLGREHGNELQIQGREQAHDLAKTKAKEEAELTHGLMDYETVKKFAGDEVAEFYKAAPTGGKTKIVEAIIDSLKRKKRFGDQLSQAQGQAQEPQTKVPVQKGEVPAYELNTADMNDKEIVDYKGALRKENMPIWKDTIEQVKDFKELERDIKILNTINEKKNLPEGMEKFLIDPETGAPYPLGTIIKTPHKDVQLWAKTIARQATRAQTAFPGRVTNFDLSSYMRQFPGLFNTYDGRKAILGMMELTNKANLLISSALAKVYAKHKLSGITPEDAFDLARSMVDEDIGDIDRQLVELAAEGEILAEPPQKLSGKMVDVLGPDGKMYEIDESEVGELPEGYRIK